MRFRLRGALLLGLMILAGCIPPRDLEAEFAEDTRWLDVYNRWNRALEQLNADVTSGAADPARGYRLLRDSTRTAMDSLNLVSSAAGRARAPLLYTLLQRIRYNLLASELGRLDPCVAQLGKLAGRADSLAESGEFASAERLRQALDRSADSLDLIAKTLLDEDLRSAWDTLQAPLSPVRLQRTLSDARHGSAGAPLQAPLSPLSLRGSEFGPRYRVEAGDSIPADPGELRARLQRLNESTRRLQREIAGRRPAQMRRGWIRRANTLVEELNAAVGVNSAGDHLDALRRLTSVRESAASALDAMVADTTRWPGRPAPTHVPLPTRPSSPPGDPEDAVREVLRLVELNEEAICYGLAVDLYQNVSRRLALGDARSRADAASLDSVLADPRLDPGLRRMIVGLRKDLGAVHGPAAPIHR